MQSLGCRPSSPPGREPVHPLLASRAPHRESQKAFGTNTDTERSQTLLEGVPRDLPQEVGRDATLHPDAARSDINKGCEATKECYSFASFELRPTFTTNTTQVIKSVFERALRLDIGHHQHNTSDIIIFVFALARFGHAPRRIWTRSKHVQNSEARSGLTVEPKSGFKNFQGPRKSKSCRSHFLKHCHKKWKPDQATECEATFLFPD